MAALAFCAVASAKTIRGNDRDNLLEGTSSKDKNIAKGGDDRIFGGDGADKVSAGTGDDPVNGEDGNDTVKGSDGDDVIIAAGDGSPDEVQCGQGRDRAVVDAGDQTLDCEQVE